MLTAREGELSAEEVVLRGEHLAGCTRCTALAEELAATDGLVRDALLAEASRRDFAPFVDGVLARVKAQAVVGEAMAGASRGAEPPDVGIRGTGILSRLRAWARAHRAAALAGTLAPTLAAAALIVYLSSSAAPVPLAGEIEVVAEGTVPVVLETSEGPVVLLGEAGGT
jgi:hypothetical protein